MKATPRNAFPVVFWSGFRQGFILAHVVFSVGVLIWLLVR